MQEKIRIDFYLINNMLINFIFIKRSIYLLTKLILKQVGILNSAEEQKI